MSERDTTTLLGRSGTPEVIADIDAMKARIVELLEGCPVQFPIKSKREFADIFPFGTPIRCNYKGKSTSIHDIIRDMRDSDFPINNPGDAATLLIGMCDVS